MDVESTAQPRPIPDPEPVPRPIRDGGLTGWVVVLLAERVPPGRSNDLIDHARDNLGQLDRLLGYLRRNNIAEGRRLVTSVSVEDLLRAEEAARDSAFPPLESLTRYWRIRVGDRGLDPERVARELLDLERDQPPEERGIAHAYPEMTVESPHTPAAAAAPPAAPPSARASAPALTDRNAQGWLRAKPRGVDALHAWTVPGGQGEGVRIVDLEQGWRFDHPDIVGLATAPLVGLNRYTTDPADGDHGTSVLGVLAGRVNTLGGSGIASGAQEVAVCSHYDGTDTVQIVDALAVAREHLSPGDVLLLEVSFPRTGDLCAETDDAVYTAMRSAAAKGIVIVEAAGNGNRDLSAWQSDRGRTLVRGDTYLDSGAVIVAGAYRDVLTVTGVVGHQRHHEKETNYGTRVDCYAWGEHVQAPAVNGHHAFDGSSSAAAIIAGVAAVAQGIQRHRGGAALDSPAMRDVLAGPDGTPQVPTTTPFTIGVMPNLRAIEPTLPR